MAETVRVRCAVASDVNGETAVYGIEECDPSSVVNHLRRIGYGFVQWITVEIPLPVEPVVVAEVEDGE